MEASASLLGCCSSSSTFYSKIECLISSLSSSSVQRNRGFLTLRCQKPRRALSSLRSSICNSIVTLEEETENSRNPVASDKDMLPKIDKSGRFCSPRAARELALMVAYAACLEGSDPVRLYEKRMNMRREPGYEFDEASLLEYNHMSFGGPPVTTNSAEEADELMQEDEKESAIEAEVLSAPPKLVYSKLILRFTRKLLVAMVDQWDTHVVVINRVAPPNWKAKYDVIGTLFKAVDLAKRFCDGDAPRIINGCLRSFLKGTEAAPSSHTPHVVAEEMTAKALS
ncbi:hypothetical protein SAY87_013044 [Trapa incisa]|uniref:NusB/RsmB/TIM44 domain-containing protein n=1 Tax=Trapa incisa TaxID=236973 RepID=A0AAN7QCB7_9MYRT|nr:hypothetical protein SAY87_013044 [Trapa incisa]